MSSSSFDYLIVGAGFAGSVLAERLASTANQRVLVIDRRPHIAGNAHDYIDSSGVLVHAYGPHIFHCNSPAIFDYLSRFTEWRFYEHRVLSNFDGRLYPFPINLDTVNQLYGLDLDSTSMETWLQSVAQPRARIETSEDAVVSKVGWDLYATFFRGYTQKHWGLDPSELDAQVAARIPVRTNRDDRYFTDTFQFMPLHGYTRMFERMLDHPNISVHVDTDFRHVRDSVSYRELIYTGPIDEYFEFRFGRLPYRSLRFDFLHLPQESFQSVAQVNFPNDHAYTRITEFKRLTGQSHPGTTIAYEYPTDEGDPYYPVPRPENAALYKQYEALARKEPAVHFVGRLATYRYYNMDQVVAQALTTFDRIQQR